MGTEPQKNYRVKIARMFVWVSLQSCLFNKHTMVVVVVKPADDGSYFVDTITKKVSLLSSCLLATTDQSGKWRGRVMLYVA